MNGHIDTEYKKKRRCNIDTIGDPKKEKYDHKY